MPTSGYPYSEGRGVTFSGILERDDFPEEPLDRLEGRMGIGAVLVTE